MLTNWQVSTFAKLIAVSLISIISFGSDQATREIRVKRVVGVDYPKFARMGGIQGNVEAIATVSADGTVQKVRVVSGPEPLRRVVTESVSLWRFVGCASPDISCDVRIEFSFALEGLCDVSEPCPTHFEVDLPDKVRVTSKLARAIVN